MKRKITLSIALVLSIILGLLINSKSRVEAQNQVSIVADTGVITLGPNQVLRMATTGGGQLLGNLLKIRFRQLRYIEQDNIYTVSQQFATDPITLEANEAATVDISPNGSNAVRGLVISNQKNLRVTAMIINTSTGEVTSQIIMANTEGDFH